MLIGPAFSHVSPRLDRESAVLQVRPNRSRHETRQLTHISRLPISFGPYIDSLHILMQYAPLGSLEDYLAERSGSSGGPAGAGGPDVMRSGQGVEDVKAAFRARRGSQKPVERGERRGVRLMGKAEIDGIFGGVVRGLGYLVHLACLTACSLLRVEPLTVAYLSVSAQP